MSLQGQFGDASPETVQVESGSPVFSTTPTGTPRVTPAPLHPVPSSHLRLSSPTPAPTRHSSLARRENQDQFTEANDTVGQGFGNTDDHRASSISAISALSFSPYKLRDYDRTVDRFEMSSDDEDDKDKDPSSFRIYEEESLQQSDKPSEESATATRRPKNWYSTPPRTPASANTTESAMISRAGELGQNAIAGVGYASSIGPSSMRGVKGTKGESVTSSYETGSRHESGGTARSGERRGSEAKNWEEVHAARREAAAAVKLVDLTNATQEADQGSIRHYPSSSTRATKSPPLPVNDSPTSGFSRDRYPSTSTQAIKSPKPTDDLATPTTSALSQISRVSTPSSTRAMKSPSLPNDDLATPKSGFSIASETTSGRAEKGLHVPFLPKFLRLTVGRTSSDTARRPASDITPTRVSDETNRKGSASSSAGRQGSASSGGSRRGSIPVASNGQPLQSVFEADDSDEYDDEGTVIGNATTVTAARPKVVRQSASGREVVGLQEILKEDPTAAKAGSIKGDTSPTISRVARFLGENVRFGSKRGGIVGLPIAREAEDVALVQNVKDGKPVGLGVYQEPNYADGLRSNPIRRAATVPVKRERKVTFPPPPVDVGVGMQPEQREKELRESIVSTPYPLGYKKEGQPSTTENRKRENGKDIITLVIYSPHSSNRLAKVKQVVLPRHKDITLVDDSFAKQPQIRATIRRDFDDHAFINHILKSYASIRGPFSAFTSARTITSLKLIGYTDIYQLRASTSPPYLAALNGDDITGPKLQHLLEKPKRGMQQHEITGFVSQLPGNTAYDPAKHSDGKVAIQLVEGWAVRRITVSVAAVLLLSFLATLLWVTAGVAAPVFTITSAGPIGDGSGNADAGTLAASSQVVGLGEGSFRVAAGGRVETGVLLGLLVLLMGWTGVVAWVALSWIVS